LPRSSNTILYRTKIKPTLAIIAAKDIEARMSPESRLNSLQSSEVIINEKTTTNLTHGVGEPEGGMLSVVAVCVMISPSLESVLELVYLVVGFGVETLSGVEVVSD